MAIEPIQLPGFSRNPTGVEAILARGGSAFGSILRDAVQIGRDQSNLQASQERDLIAEQRREINLTQRRGELVQDQANADRRFGEDQRQFDTKFGEGVRQFDTNVVENNVDRGLKVRQLDLQAQGQAATIEQGKERTEIEKQKLATDKEDLTFRRNEASESKKQRDEVHRVNLDTAKLQLQQAQGKEAQDAAKQAYAKAQAGALVKMDELLKGGDMEAAKSYFRTTIEGYDFDPGTKSRFAKQLGIEGKTGESEIGAEPLTDAQLAEELATLKGAVNPKDNTGEQVERASEKTALRISQIEQEMARRKRPAFMDAYKQ